MTDFLLPDAFEEYSEARKAGFLKVKAAKEQGQKVAGCFCAFTPLEILDAAGLLTVSLCGMSPETIPAAETELPRNLCPLIKSSYGFYLTDKCPYTYFADLIVGETTCDGKKKMYELLGKGKETYVLHLPQGRDVPYALEMWTEELRRFVRYLEERFAVKITDEKLREAIRQRNALREARCRLMELLKADTLPISGTELYTFLDGIGFNFDIKDAIAKTRALADSLSGQQSPAVTPNGKRILVTGCPIGGVFQKVVGAVERAGGNVVCFENCSGIKPARCKVDENADDPIAAIAKAYLDIGCAVMTPDSKRFENLPALAKAFRADAVLDVALQACHTYLIEGRTIRDICKERGVPYMALETDYATADAGQIDTRIAAFIETLGE
ncbi:MAG: 2-hydroxyacyl-CoA dehydratase [Clostridia bacterium]|nr:2-hydroxyacyl-CoA dehydratase [Clostridia bacterium]